MNLRWHTTRLLIRLAVAVIERVRPTVEALGLGVRPRGYVCAFAMGVSMSLRRAAVITAPPTLRAEVKRLLNPSTPTTGGRGL